MPAGSDLTSSAIAPGSTAYGERGNLEAGIAAGMPPAGGGGGAPPSPQIPESAMGAMLSGIVPGGQGPLTSGLSVGPGAGQPMTEDPMMGDRANRLRMIASQASSPQLRALARSELQRMVREPL